MNLNTPAMYSNKLLRDWQANSTTNVNNALWKIGLKKGFEYFIKFVFRDSDTGVAYFDMQPLFIATRHMR